MAIRPNDAGEHASPVAFRSQRVRERHRREQGLAKGVLVLRRDGFDVGPGRARDDTDNQLRGRYTFFGHSDRNRGLAPHSSMEVHHGRSGLLAFNHIIFNTRNSGNAWVEGRKADQRCCVEAIYVGANACALERICIAPSQAALAECFAADAIETVESAVLHRKADLRGRVHVKGNRRAPPIVDDRHADPRFARRL
eukprot:2743312-Prymnesium_polylepis.1